MYVLNEYSTRITIAAGAMASRFHDGEIRSEEVIGNLCRNAGVLRGLVMCIVPMQFGGNLSREVKFALQLRQLQFKFITVESDIVACGSGG